MKTRIALIHALPMSFGPVAAAFGHLWPEAQTQNILDDSLSVDRERAGALTPELAARIQALADYALRCGAHAILYTCSAFGPAIEAVARGTAEPVLKPNEAMFEDALKIGKRIGMLATFQPSISGMEDEFRAQAGKSAATISSLCVPEAMAALRRGDAATHHRLLAEAADRAELRGCDVLMLAQFSMAPALLAVQAVARCPVLTSPDSAVRKLRSLLAG